MFQKKIQHKLFFKVLFDLEELCFFLWTPFISSSSENNSPSLGTYSLSEWSSWLVEHVAFEWQVNSGRILPTQLYRSDSSSLSSSFSFFCFFLLFLSGANFNFFEGGSVLLTAGAFFFSSFRCLASSACCWRYFSRSNNCEVLFKTLKSRKKRLWNRLRN